MLSWQQRSRLKLDPYQAVSVYPRDSVGDRHSVAYMAVLDENGAPMGGVSYQSSSAGAAPSGAQSEGWELIVVSDSDGSSSDDSELPIYLCTQCHGSGWWWHTAMHVMLVQAGLQYQRQCRTAQAARKQQSESSARDRRRIAP